MDALQKCLASLGPGAATNTAAPASSSPTAAAEVRRRLRAPSDLEQKEVEAGFHELDTDGSGKIDTAEEIALLQGRLKGRVDAENEAQVGLDPGAPGQKQQAQAAAITAAAGATTATPPHAALERIAALARKPTAAADGGAHGGVPTSCSGSATSIAATRAGPTAAAPHARPHSIRAPITAAMRAARASASVAPTTAALLRGVRAPRGAPRQRASAVAGAVGAVAPRRAQRCGRRASASAPRRSSCRAHRGAMRAAEEKAAKVAAAAAAGRQAAAAPAPAAEQQRRCAAMRRRPSRQAGQTAPPRRARPSSSSERAAVDAPPRADQATPAVTGGDPLLHPHQDGGPHRRLRVGDVARAPAAARDRQALRMHVARLVPNGEAAGPIAHFEFTSQTVFGLDESYVFHARGIGKAVASEAGAMATRAGAKAVLPRHHNFVLEVPSADAWPKQDPRGSRDAAGVPAVPRVVPPRVEG